MERRGDRDGRERERERDVKKMRWGGGGEHRWKREREGLKTKRGFMDRRGGSGM